MYPDDLKAIHAELEKRASEQEADKLEAEAEANNAQAEADRQKADAARMKESALAEAGDLLKTAMRFRKSTLYSGTTGEYNISENGIVSKGGSRLGKMDVQDSMHLMAELVKGKGATWDVGGKKHTFGPPPEEKTASVSDFDKGKLSNKIRRMINGKLNRVGLDGNGRFRTPQKGYVRALDVLQGFGIELGEVVSSSHFREDANEFNIHLSFKNMDDPFSPSDIKNTMLHISYTKLEDDRYEVLAYMT